MTDTCFVPLAGCLVWTDKWFFPASVVRSPFLVVVALLLGSDGRACVHKEGSAEAAVGGAPLAGCVTHGPTARGSRSLSVAAVLVGKQALKLPPCLPPLPLFAASFPAFVAGLLPAVGVAWLQDNCDSVFVV